MAENLKTYELRFLYAGTGSSPTKPLSSIYVRAEAAYDAVDEGLRIMQVGEHPAGKRRVRFLGAHKVSDVVEDARVVGAATQTRAPLPLADAYRENLREHGAAAVSPGRILPKLSHFVRRWTAKLRCPLCGTTDTSCGAASYARTSVCARCGAQMRTWA